MCKTLTQHLVKLLDDAVEIMESSHSQRLLQYQSQVDALVEDYEAALTGRYQLMQLILMKASGDLILLVLLMLFSP